MKRFFLFFLFLAFSLSFGEDLKLFPSSKTLELSAREPFELNILVKIPKDSHIYSKNESKLGLPTELKLKLPEGYKLLDTSWDAPIKENYDGAESLVYKNQFNILAKILPAPKLEEGSTKFEIELSYLLCNTSCIPAESKASFEIATKASFAKDTNAGSKLLLMILGAFLGGMILNLMPCVFPVIALKILSFAKDANESRKLAIKNSLYYCLGIILSLLALGGALALLKTFGFQLGWGFQLQEPIFVALLAIVFFTLGLALMGYLEIGAGLAAKFAGGKGSFSAGVLAVLAASPCTAPFMGVALGFALASDSGILEIFCIFFAMGLGMALPYIVLSAVPVFAKLLPKPGAWMETLKNILALPLFLTVIWLLWVFTKQCGADGLAYLLFSIFLVFLSLFILRNWGSPLRSKFSRILAKIFALLFFILAIFFAFNASKKESASEENANSWSDERVSALQAEGKIVYVDFSAAWCATCLTNKKVVLDTKFIKDYFEKNNVILLHADWTNRNAKIANKLAEFNRSGVPLNIVYPKDKNSKPIILPEILTKEAVIEAIDKAKR